MQPIDASLIVAVTGLLGLMLSSWINGKGQRDQREQQAAASELAAREQTWEETTAALNRVSSERDLYWAELSARRRAQHLHQAWDQQAIRHARAAGVILTNPPSIEGTNHDD